MAIRIDEDDLMQKDSVSTNEIPPATEAVGTIVSEEAEEEGSGMDVDAMYDDLENAVKQRQAEEKERLTGRYDAQVEDTNDLLKAVDEERKEKAKKDETARKREKAYGLVAGIGDAISGFANLYGTTKNAAHQQQTYATPKVMERAEAMRKERKLDAQALKERSKELEAQRRALRTSYEADAAEMDAKHGRELSDLSKSRIKSAVDVYKTETGAASKSEAEAGKTYRHTTPKATTSKGGTSNRAPEDEHRIEISDTETIVVQDHKLPDTTLSNLYNMIPESERTKIPMTDRYGDIVYDGVNARYKSPSRIDMLNDVIRSARTNAKIQKALRKIGKVEKQ